MSIEVGSGHATEPDQTSRQLIQNQNKLESLVKQRTARIAESEQTFRSFYEAIPDIGMITSLETGLIVSVNEGFYYDNGFQ